MLTVFANGWYVHVRTNGWTLHSTAKGERALCQSAVNQLQRSLSAANYMLNRIGAV